MSSPAAKKAFDVSREDAKVREAYGKTTVGQGALLARRLVESGVRVVSVSHNGYDTHLFNKKGCDKLYPEFDTAFTTLLEDLQNRGLLKTTLVLVLTEFGRTPKYNSDGGRDHYRAVFSVALAGAGISGGVVIGSSTRDCSEPKDDPVSPDDLMFTVYKVLGIDPTKEFRVGGRPIKIANGKFLDKLFA